MAYSKPVKTYIVVGAGVFGVSTALELLARGERVKVVDPSNLKSASHDISKIVRGDYVQPLYIKLGAKAMSMWYNSPLYSRYFHGVGFIRAQLDDFSQSSLQAHKKLGIPTNYRWMTQEEVRQKWPAYATSDFGDLKKVIYYPDYGFVEATPALQAASDEARRKGAEFLKAEATRLVRNESGDCTGVVLDSGEEISGTVLLCTGARTASLLADSGLDAGDKIRATGALSFTVTLDDDDEMEMFRDIPVFKNRQPGVMGESMSRHGNVLKFNCDMCFTREQVHDATNTSMSQMPTDKNLTEWTKEGIPENLKQLAYGVIRGIFGDRLAGKTIEQFRICWDSYTPKHDFIISPYAGCRNLYIAGGGSFHGWKFFPVIGEYVVQMLEGTLDAEYAKLWAWERGSDGPPANTTYLLGGDLGDML